MARKSRLQEALYRRAISWAGQLTRLAKSLAPDHVRKAISSKVEKKKDGKVLIRITADRKIAPDARAWEYGSGIHARRGLIGKYLIRPKNKKVLAFNWEVANQNPDKFNFLPDGRVMLPQVEHPGIEAANGGRGYIAPAIRQLRKRAKSELSKEIKQAILGDIRAAFGHGKRR